MSINNLENMFIPANCGERRETNYKPHSCLIKARVLHMLWEQHAGSTLFVMIFNMQKPLPDEGDSMATMC